ncbi:TolC family protein [Thermaurantiacus tibetensis]|uniref:TolC family protein n=1 Tax=Thermaurantiacus tibetensis TaxID=2759035 RepID=UPI00188E9391|nr:TolC family protein [Thermaurantiacus tibetensis]
MGRGRQAARQRAWGSRALARAAVRACALASAPALAQPALAQPALAYAAAQERLLAQSDALAAAAAGLRAAEARAEAVETLGRRPEVEVEAQVLDFRKTLFLPLGPLAPVAEAFGLPDPLRFRLERPVRRPLVTATWPLYAGGQIGAAKAAAGARVGIEEAGRDAAAEEALARLARAYFGAQLAAEAHAIRRAVVAGVAAHVAAARALEREQQIAPAQRLQAEAALEEAEREAERAAADLAAATAALEGLLRLDGPVRLSTPLAVPPAPLPPLAEFLAAAEARHPALRRLEAGTRLAEAGVAAEQAKLRPTVYAVAQANLDTRNSLLVDPDYILGVGLKYQLVSGANRRREVAAARETVAQAEASAREARAQLETGVRVAHARAEAARRRHALYARTIAAADEALRVARLSFRELQGTSRDVTDSELQAGRVRVEQARAAYDYVEALVDLLAASGQLAELPRFLAAGAAP